VELTTDE